MSELPPDIRKLLEQTRGAHDPGAAAPARVWSGLAGRLGVPLPPLPPLPTVPPPPAPPVVAVAAKATLIKLLSGALLVAAGGAAVGTYDRVVAFPPAPVAEASAAVATSSTPATTVTASPPLPSEPVPSEPSEPTPEPQPVAPLPSAVEPPLPPPVAAPRDSAHRATSALRPSAAGWEGLPAPVTAPVETADSGDAPANPGPGALTTPNATTLSRELTLLKEAESALGRGDATTALALTDEHARLYPAGALRQERMATRALALCAAHRIPEAQALATTLATEAPRSPYADRLRVSCAGWPTR